jgi:hypothetical protein
LQGPVIDTTLVLKEDQGVLGGGSGDQSLLELYPDVTDELNVHFKHEETFFNEQEAAQNLTKALRTTYPGFT